MKKWGIFLLVIIGFAIFGLKHLFINEIQIIETGIISNASETMEMKTIEIAVEQIYQGNLLLVNAEYPVNKKSVTSDVIQLHIDDTVEQGFSLLNHDIYLSEEIAGKFSRMIAAAEKDGIKNFTINSAYRSHEQQHLLFEEVGEMLALPAGHSEHNLGLALDVGSTDNQMAEAAEGKWIENNAWQHGFILRYPLHKTEITGIQYEPWHIRYVGIPHSALMEEKDFVLEEYLDYLKKENRVTIQIGKSKFIIIYYPITQNKQIQVPRNNNYEISGDNMDGVIVTIEE